MLHEETKNPQYPYSRRQFVKGVAAFGVLSAMPWLSSCEHVVPVEKGVLGEHSQMAADVLGILFPNDGNGPSSKDLRSYEYLNWVLGDENYDVDIKRSIHKGFDRLAEFSIVEHGKPFGKMSPKGKVGLVSQITEYGWGENLLARLISMILDSLVIDPIYGMNMNEVGWRWMEHIPGQPRATASNKYPQILDRKKELVIISNLLDL